MHEHDPLISSYSHEVARPRAPEALHILRRVSSMVKPLMRRRGWRVTTLAEFYPSQVELLGLNWNRGSKICLRLRYPSDETQFLPFENVVDTMLHELAHIEHGPHDQAFHALWDKLRDEYETLLLKGYSGEGFLSQGHRLGGSGHVSQSEWNRRQRAASSLAGVQQGRAESGGRRLGGRRARPDEDIREVIASAAERRKVITRGCASGREGSSAIIDQVSHNGFRTQADEDEATERAIMDAVIELIEQEERERRGETSISPALQSPATPARNAPPVPLATKPIMSSPLAASSSSSRGGSHERQAPSVGGGNQRTDGQSWTCSICTLLNQPTYLCCDACGSQRPSTLTAADYRDDTSVMELNQLASARRQQEAADFEFPKPSTSLPSSTSLDRASGTRNVARKRPRDDLNTLRPRRSSKTSLDKIYHADKNKPIGWKCVHCGSFMETQWWTCSLCGKMKDSS